MNVPNKHTCHFDTLLENTTHLIISLWSPFCRCRPVAAPPIPGVRLRGDMSLGDGKSSHNNFGNIHVDAKNSEESESGVIFTITRLKNGQKMSFVLSFRDFEFSTYPNKSTFLTDFGPGYGKNKPRFGFLSNFCVDMYITKIFPRRFFGFLGSFSPKIVCFLVLRKHLFQT